MKWTDFKHIYLETDGPVSFSVTKERMWTSTPLGMLCTAKGFDKEKDKYVLTGGHSLKSKRGMPLEGTLWLTNSVPDVSRLEIANIIASLCCTEMEVERKNNDGEWVKLKRNVLPQGAPTSPVITNMVCQRLDFVFTGVAKRFGLKYSRYVDDITFSSMHNVFQPESDFLKEIHRIISEQGFHVNESKTRLQKRGYRQEVTGLLVNEKANVQKRYIKQIRMWLYYWETYGYGKATSFFLKQYKTEKVQVKNGLPDMANVIGGKLDYLKMVKGGDDVLYFKLKKRFDVLLKKGMQENIVPHSKAKEEEISSMYVSNEVDGTRVIEISNNVLENLGYKREKEKLFPIRHNPKELVSLLRNFSVNDSPLKYTTHSWDAGRDAKMFKDLNQFLDLAKKQYSSFSFHLKTLSENLNGKIYNFLFNKNINEKGWGVYRIKFGWSSLELLNACEMKQEMNPEDFVLPSIYQIQVEGKTIQKFKQIIDIFKNEIEIRDENSALYNLLIKRHETYLLSFTDPIINSLENKTFYTDVQWLSKALDQIFENIQNRPQHRLVKYSIVNEKEESFELEILHVGSFNTGKSIYDEKLSLLKGNFGDICKYLKNLCDWSIESQFAEGYYRINYLTSMDSVPPYQKIENAEGFKHILTFYK